MHNRRCGFATASLPISSGQAIPVVEASVEIGLDGELQFHFRQVPGGRDRSQPPSLGEIIAALSKYQHVEMTPEQHRAVLEVLAVCGWPSDRLWASGRGRRAAFGGAPK
jgi:hypothetical protein